MSGILKLTWRYLTFNWVKSLILLVCLTITIFLPLALHQLIAYYEAELGQRARQTPLVIGAKGDRFDLILSSLYFKGAAPGTITASELDQLRDSGRARAIPMFLGFTAQKNPIVGTTTDYFRFRNLTPLYGSLPLQLGDAVIGKNVADQLGLSAGDALLSDEASLIYIGGSYPLKMLVTGVLKKTGTPDDDAVFTDIKTSWIIAGIGHGHTDLQQPEAKGFVAEQDGNAVTANPAVFTYNEITEDNIASFHFHSEREQLPITAIITIPNSSKDRTLLKASYSVDKKAQMLVPATIIEELMGIVFQVKRFFDGSFLLVLLATALFLVLVILLSLRIRKRERQTMFHIGCDRLTILWLQVAELAILLAVATLLALTLAHIATHYASDFI